MSSILAEQITQQALALSDDERAELAERLALSLAKPELSAAWSKEVKVRLERVRSGRVKTICEEDAIAQLDAASNGED